MYVASLRETLQNIYKSFVTSQSRTYFFYFRGILKWKHPYISPLHSVHYMKLLIMNSGVYVVSLPYSNVFLSTSAMPTQSHEQEYFFAECMYWGKGQTETVHRLWGKLYKILLQVGFWQGEEVLVTRDITGKNGKSQGLCKSTEATKINHEEEEWVEQWGARWTILQVLKWICSVQNKMLKCVKL